MDRPWIGQKCPKIYRFLSICIKNFKKYAIFFLNKIHKARGIKNAKFYPDSKFAEKRSKTCPEESYRQKTMWMLSFPDFALFANVSCF